MSATPKRQVPAKQTFNRSVFSLSFVLYSHTHAVPVSTEFGRRKFNGESTVFDADFGRRRQPPDLPRQKFNDSRRGHGGFGETRRPL